MVRLADVVRAISEGGQERRLREAARPIADIPTAKPQEDLESVLERIGPALERRVLVFDKGVLVGILSPADVGRVVMVRRALASEASRSQ